MIKKAALAFGVVFVLIGLLGFVGALTPDSKLLGLFLISPLHNLVHLLSGVAALAASKTVEYSRMYFKVFGVVYALVTVLGVLFGTFLGLFDINTADNLLHLLIAAVALYFGFAYKNDAVRV